MMILMAVAKCSYPDSQCFKIPAAKCSFCNMEQNVVFVAVMLAILNRIEMLCFMKFFELN